jgi:hypothetical protein
MRDWSFLEVEVLEPVCAEIHTMMRRLAAEGEAADRGEIVAQFCAGVDALCRKLGSRHGLDGPSAAAAISMALGRASELLRAEMGRISAGEGAGQTDLTHNRP